MSVKLQSLLSGLFLGTAYGGIAFYTTALKSTGLNILFISSGMILASIGAGLLWVIEKVGLVSDPGMGGGILIFALGGYVLWVAIFSLVSFFAINKYVASKNH